MHDRQTLDMSVYCLLIVMHVCNWGAPSGVGIRQGNHFCTSPFLPRCMECRRGLTMRILSVRPSVRLSNACIVTKRKKAMFTFLYHTKEHLS